jgi:hypothetical protein
MKKDLIIAIIRHSLTFVGGLFIMKGVLDETIVTELVGGVVSLTSVVWMAIDKIKNQ